MGEPEPHYVHVKFTGDGYRAACSTPGCLWVGLNHRVFKYMGYGQAVALRRCESLAEDDARRHKAEQRKPSNPRGSGVRAMDTPPRCPCKVDDRVRLTGPLVNADSTAIPVEDIPVGTEGTVKFINTACGPDVGYQIAVAWDNGAGLDLMPGDRFEVIS